jgi:hypothetical protein
MILINNNVSYLNNKNKIMYHFENHFENHYKNNNNLRRNTGVLFEKTDQEILFVEKNDTLYEKNHTVNEYEINLNTDIMKMTNDFTIFIMGNDW